MSYWGNEVLKLEKAAQVALEISSILWLFLAPAFISQVHNQCGSGGYLSQRWFGSLPVTPLAEIHLASRPGT